MMLTAPAQYNKINRAPCRIEMSETNNHSVQPISFLQAPETSVKNPEQPGGKNKLLSPFTWSKLNIKLPGIPAKPSTLAILEQGSANNKSKNRAINRIKLNALHETIDARRSLHKEPKSTDLVSDRQHRRRDSLHGRYWETSQDQRQDESLAIRNLKKQVILKHTQRRHLNPETARPRSIMQTSVNFHYTPRQPRHATPDTFTCTKMEPYIYRGLLKCGWTEMTLAKQSSLPELVWSDSYSDSSRLAPQQLHNHIKNCHILTTKHSLHELHSMAGSSFYPQSYLMPSEYDTFCQDYETTIVKIVLRGIVKTIGTKIDYGTNVVQSLGEVLGQITNRPHVDEDTLMGVRLCLYLEHYRKARAYRFFEGVSRYVPIETNLQASVVTSLLKACYEYWEQLVGSQDHPTQAQACNYFKVANMDIKVLQLLWSYHCMLVKHQPQYNGMLNRNQWIVKPIASSRGAGISLLRPSPGFLPFSQDRSEHSNKSKYANKIIQKYIENPLLLAEAGQYSGVKFDIRQWVLVTCNPESQQPLVYVYENGYCRFCDLRFTYVHQRSQESRVHLTNYSVSDKTKGEGSVLLLSELFAEYMPDLRPKYESQMRKIVVETILNARELQLEPNRFELLGFDVLFDSSHKLWLLEVNMNPACQASRAHKLEAMSHLMISSMMDTVKSACGKGASNKKGWDLVYGKQGSVMNLEQPGFEPQIKPFYSISLGKDSLVEQVRRRTTFSRVTHKIISKIVSNLYSHCWAAFKTTERPSQSGPLAQLPQIQEKKQDASSSVEAQPSNKVHESEQSEPQRAEGALPQMPQTQQSLR